MKESLFVEDANGKVKLDDGAFAEAFVKSNHLIYYNGAVHDQIGQIVSSDEGQHAIYQLLRGLNITNRLAGRTKDLWEDIKYEAYTNHINVADNQIAVQNGTITVNLKTGECSFQEVLNFSLHRLNCNFNPKSKVKRPTRFLEWVDSLIHECDRDGFQEYCGYLLLPNTKLQKALVLLGRGQEGKSRIGLILHYLFGSSCVSSSVEYFENNQFALPRAQDALILFQDDLRKEKLKSTENFKMMVSAEVPMQAEPKGEAAYSFQPYARWVICSNSPLTALSDSGHGFFRRLYVIRVKNRPSDRKDDPFYFEPMKDEMDGIFLWFLQGLQRLIPHVPTFADGGFVDEGQLFIARESGAEMVGNIGRKTAVANNDQIVESVSQGVYEAVQRANGENYASGNRPITVIVQMNGKEMYRQIVDENKAAIRATGFSPLLV